MWSKILNVFRGERVNRDLDDELQSHLDEAVEQGRDPQDARRAFGSSLHTREASRDFKLSARLDSLRAGIVFGWRHLLKSKVPSAAAVLSLGLATGACVTGFRLIDALLLRPLPVASPERLNYLAFQSAESTAQSDNFEYPHFR